MYKIHLYRENRTKGKICKHQYLMYFVVKQQVTWYSGWQECETSISLTFTIKRFCILRKTCTGSNVSRLHVSWYCESLYR